MKAAPAATCKHGNPPVACAPCKYPALYRIAEDIEREVRDKINERAPKAQADTPYPAQAVLEMLIALLQKGV